MFGEMLRASWSEGLLVVHAERLSDAAHELREHPPTCALLDLGEPDADQLAQLEQIRTAAANAPVIVLCERDDEGLALAAVRAGAQDFLLKPQLHPALLRRAVKYAVERKRSEVQLVHQALHDSVTGLPNRALFLDRLGVALDRARRSHASIAVFFLDVDNFKDINDSFGHACGDRLLIGLAERLQTMLRPMDTVARFGGDEFTFLFEDLGGEREVVLIAERINRAVQLPIGLGQNDVSVTVSIGIAIVSDPSTTAEAVIRDADAAMYRAKELGRSRYELFDEASRQRASERLELEAALRHAVERAELRLHYQPTVSLTNGAHVRGLEALVRWQHPERGLIPPRDFIPLAEETSLTLPIGHYVLEQALAQVERWHQHNPGMTVSVNVSARQLTDMSLTSMLTGAMNATTTRPDSLCLEFSEISIAQDTEAALRALHGLKAIGVQLAIDDYGTGSTPLPVLKRLPIDTIKIHESLVSGLGSDPKQGPIVAAVVQLGHALGLRVVAEGVETDAQLAELRAVGFDGAQGFLFGRPVPEEQVQAMLSSPAGDGWRGRSGP